MAPEKQKLDDIFRKKIESIDSGDEKIPWKPVNDLLDAADRKKRRRVIWFFTLLALFVSTAIYFYSNKESIPKNYSEIIPQENKTAPEEITASSTNDLIVLPGKSNDVQNEFKTNSINTTTSGSKSDINNIIQSKNISENKSIQANKPSNTSAKNPVYQSEKNDKPLENNSIIGSNQVEEKSETAYSDILQASFESNNNDSTRNLFGPSLADSANTPIEDTVKDSNVADPDSLKRDSTEAKIRRKWSAYILAGGGYHLNPKTLTPIGGVSIERILCNKLSLSLSVYYSELSGMNLHDSSMQEKYFLDKTTSMEHLKIEKVKMINVPLWARYSISKHSFLLGMNFYYLLDSKSDYTVSSNMSHVETSSIENNLSGYMDGFNQFNFALQSGYIYSFSQKIEAGLIYQQCLDNPIDEEYFGESEKYFNSSLFGFMRIKFY